MDAITSHSQIQATKSSSISEGGFSSKDKDNLTFTKNITVNNEEYTIAITFKPSDSAKQKEVFLKNYGDNAEKVVNIAISLGLGKVKAPTENKTTRNYTVTAINFQSDKDGFKASKTKTNTDDGTSKASAPKAKYKSKEDDSESIKTHNLEKNKNLGLMGDIYNRMSGSTVEKSQSGQTENQFNHQSLVPEQKDQHVKTTNNFQKPVNNSSQSTLKHSAQDVKERVELAAPSKHAAVSDVEMRALLKGERGIDNSFPLPLSYEEPDVHGSPPDYPPPTFDELDVHGSPPDYPPPTFDELDVHGSPPDYPPPLFEEPDVHELNKNERISNTNDVKTEETDNSKDIGRAERITMDAAKEVHTSEITYVGNLEDLKLRTTSMQKDDQPKEIREFGKNLELQLNSLLPSSSNYLSGLDEAMKKTDLYEVLDGICENYAENKETLFKPFEEYAQKFDGLLETLKQLNKQYPDQMQSLNSPKPSALNLQALLILPIQRGPRHVMTPTEVAGNFNKLNSLKGEVAKNFLLANKLSETVNSNKKRMDVVNQSKKLFDVDAGIPKLQDLQKKIAGGYKGKMKDSELIAVQSMRSRYDSLGVGFLNRGKVGTSDSSLNAVKNLYDTLKKLERDIEPLANQEELDALNPELKPLRDNCAAQLNELRESLKKDEWVSKSLANLKLQDRNYNESKEVK